MALFAAAGDFSGLHAVLLVGGVIGYILLILCSLNWLYHDAERRGKSGCGLAIIVGLFAWPIGLLIWLLARPNISSREISSEELKRAESCKRCGHTIPTGEMYCPYCKCARSG